jgi:hypothetical protein
VKTLKELIERQQTLLNENGKFEGARGAAADPPPADWDSSVDKLAKDHESLQADTAGLLTKMEERQQQMEQAKSQAASPPPPQASNQPPSPGAQPPDPAAIEKAAAKLSAATEHVVTAVNEQGAALDSLHTKALPEARPHENKSLEELVLALQELADPNQQNQQQQQQQDQDKQQSGDQKDQQNQQDQQGQQDQPENDQAQKDKDKDKPKDQPKPQSSANQDQDKNQDKDKPSDSAQSDAPDSSTDPAAAKPDAALEQARDIINEEKENQRRRQPTQLRGGRPVDKDW